MEAVDVTAAGQYSRYQRHLHGLCRMTEGAAMRVYKAIVNGLKSIGVQAACGAGEIRPA
jgi:hypothetical protein